MWFFTYDFTKYLPYKLPQLSIVLCAVCRERADLTDSISRLDKELGTLKKDLRTAHHKSTALIALKRTAEVS